MWEHWDGIKPDHTMWSPDMNSFNHYAYGAIGEWMYRVIAGIEIDEKAPGYRHILFAPKTGGNLTWAQGSYESVYGTVAIRWEEKRRTNLRDNPHSSQHNSQAHFRRVSHRARR